MIQSISHTTVYVLNQEEALEFYRDKLGFEVHHYIHFGHYDIVVDKARILVDWA